MFSLIFGKRKSSPGEDEAPPIPGPRADDGFVIVDQGNQSGGLYPSVSVPQPPRHPAPVPPIRKTKSAEQTFHYLQGVPFNMSRELQLSNNKEAYATEIGDLLAFLTNKVNIDNYNYDFSIEKSVLNEA